MFRIGFGYDAHRLVSGRKLTIGGVEIPYKFGLAGHSDADVLCHAIGDALLGAASLGDLGVYFPSTEERYRNISSLIILKEIDGLITKANWVVNNIDSTIVAEKPKLVSYLAGMKARISEILEIRADRINIKATTTEGLGFSGRREGIAAYTVVSLVVME